MAAEFDVRTDKPILRLSRHHHGNVKSSVITQDFVHGADYANPDMIRTMGKLGRSEGCFAFPRGRLVEVIARMGPGRMIFADRLEGPAHG